MGSFPFADTSTSMLMSKDGSRSAGWTGAHWDAVWWCQTPPAPVAASALLPLDDHHDIDSDSKCLRRGPDLAGARAGIFAFRLP